MGNRNILNEVTHDVSFEGRWADSMYKLMPVEQKSDGMWYKREDHFAPMGINSINGSKCRQLLWLFDREKDVDTVIHATNVNKSPQTPMTAAMAEHYGYRCIQIAGGSNFKSLSSKELPRAATLHGVEYDLVCRSGFNVGIQKRVLEVAQDHPKSFIIERDITVDHNKDGNGVLDVMAFHSVGGHQSKNIPDHIEDLILPFGSANSSTSVLYGLHLHPKKNLKRIHLVNVGVDKRDWMFERLDMMGADMSMYEIVWHDTKIPYDKLLKGVMIDDITFHPRYEAKVYQYLLDNKPELINDKSLYWVIGSYPHTETTAINLGREVPTEVNLYKEI